MSFSYSLSLRRLCVLACAFALSLPLGSTSAAPPDTALTIAERLMETQVGRMLLGWSFYVQDSGPHSFTLRLLGTTAPVEDEVLRFALRSPESMEFLKDVERRLEFFHEHVRAEDPRTAELIFQERLPIDLSITLRGRLRTVVDARFNEAFPPEFFKAPPVRDFKSLRDRFLETHPLVAEQAEPQARLVRWRTGLKEVEERASGQPNPHPSAIPALPALEAVIWGPRKTRLETLDLFDSMARDSALLPPRLVEGVLADEGQAIYAKNLRATLEAVARDRRRIPIDEKLKSALKLSLRDQVPARSIAERVRDLKGGNARSLRRALGELTLQESQELFHGPSSLRPSEESLLGRYLRETGAATVERRFPTGPGGELGPPRLVVAVSAESFPRYLALVGNNPHALIQLHGPNAGHLYVAHGGRAGDYARLSTEYRLPSEGALLPHVVLKSSEAQRVDQFFRLGAMEKSVASEPWRLPGYCAPGAYDGCSHWFGNIPIGDHRVGEYAFPGAVDDSANHRLPSDPAARVSRLENYLNPRLGEMDPRMKNEVLTLVRRVWTVPGREQLADVLGLRRQNLAAEFANPGWLAHVLTGSAPVERVPFVFLVTADHRAPLAGDFTLRIKPY